MPRYDDEQFRRAQAQFDEMEQPSEDDLPSDADVLDFCWGEDPPATRTQAAAALAGIRGGLTAIVRQ
jgi:hypothetical protein